MIFAVFFLVYFTLPSNSRAPFDALVDFYFDTFFTKRKLVCLVTVTVPNSRH